MSNPPSNISPNNPPQAWPPPTTGSYQPPEPTAPASFKPVHTLRLAAAILLSIYLEMAVLAAGLELVQAVFGANMRLYQINSVVDEIQTVSLLPCATVFLIWLYRICSNAHVFAPEQLPIGPGWAVGSFFVPVVNLFRPYQAVRDSWKASDPDLDFLADPTAWRLGKSSPVVGWWWGLWIASNTIGTIATIISLNLEGSNRGEAESFVADALGTASCIAAILLVRSLSARQEEKFPRLTASS